MMLTLCVSKHCTHIANYRDITVVEIIHFGVQCRYCPKDIIYRHFFYNNAFEVHYILYFYGQCKFKNNVTCNEIS